MMHVTEATWAMYANAKARANIAKVYDNQANQQNAARNAAQQPQQAANSSKQDRLASVRNQIANTDLTLTVPCCQGGALFDWEGCIAVKCGFCLQQHFCGFCLEFHGDSQGTHAHVRQCRLRLKNMVEQHGFFAGPGELAQARKRLYTERLDAAFARHADDPSFLSDLLALMDCDLRDLDLQPGRWSPQVSRLECPQCDE